jgi:hypothetical protein
MNENAAPLRQETVILTANGSDLREHSGTNIVRFFEATGTFSVGINGSKPVEFSKGKKFVVPQGYQVDKLELFDTSGAANTIKYYYGIVDVEDDTLQVVNASVLLGPRPDAAESLFDATLAAATATTIVSADESTAELLAHNYGANPVDITNSLDEVLDTLAAGEKARYIVTAGLKANSALGTDLRVSRFFF